MNLRWPADCDEWPIYSLADYAGGGSLINLFNSSPISNTEFRSNKQIETSDYQTGDHLISTEDSKPIGHSSIPASTIKTNSSTPNLRWWHLIDPNAGGISKTQGSSIVEFAQHVHKLTSPYLGHNTILGIPHLDFDCKQISDRQCDKPVINKLDERLVASVRRLSWRRQIFANVGSPKLRANKPFDIIHRTFTKSKDSSDVETEIKTKTPLNSLGLSSKRRFRWSHHRKHRGKYGESLTHILIVNGTNEHLLILCILLHLWPSLVSDTFESLKFKGLGCLHLAVANRDERLLAHLISVCRSESSRISSDLPIEQIVTGTLFRSPVARKTPNQSKGSRFSGFLGHRRRVNAVGVGSHPYDHETPEDRFGTYDESSFWCDRMTHWPTADGNSHLILFDRILAAAASHGLSDELDATIYLGHSPLAWSVSFKSRTMYELLVAAGANQDARDIDGNSCLHQVVINSLNGWTRFLVKMGADTEAKNEDGFTPFLLAAHLGRVSLFGELLEFSAFEFWSYSNIRCCGYPLTSLDSCLAGQNSALAVILESSASDNEQKSRLLSSAVVKKLLEEKWRIFARRQFYMEFSFALVHLLLLTVAISLKPTSQRKVSVWSIENLSEFFNSFVLEDRLELIRYSSEVAAFSLSLGQLIRFTFELFRYKSAIEQWTYNPLLPNSLVANAFIVICAPIRMASFNRPELNRLEDILLIFATPLLWSSLLFFIAAFRVTGPFVAMISHMIVRDLRQFSVIYLVFLYAFAQCIFFVNYSPELVVNETHGIELHSSNSSQPSSQLVNDYEPLVSLLKSYAELWMELFKMTFGVYDLQPFRHSTLARFFFLLFIYLIPILFNMLIAMMNNTYSQIISQSERAWSFQWARTLFALERRLGHQERVKYLQLYSINMPAPKSLHDEHHQSDGQSRDESATKRFVPGLMIIKRMDMTSAERRRLVLANWQRSIRLVLQIAKTNRIAQL